MQPPHEMRITDHGKIQSFVSFALKFLQENPQRPLVFHTFPVPKPPADLLPDNSPKKRRKLPASTTTIPRLVSVVEIVKREYAKWAAARKAADGGPVDVSQSTGLHQYNELACLEDLGIAQAETDQAEGLRMALEGKNFLKQKFTPHLKVTLSVHALPELEEKGATHQPPLPIKQSKSAKARERKRRKRVETM